MNPYTISLGELDPVEDIHLLPKNEQIIVGERRARAVLVTSNKETAFVSSSYNPDSITEKAGALHALLVAVSDCIMDDAFPVPEQPETPQLTIVP